MPLAPSDSRFGPRSEPFQPRFWPLDEAGLPLGDPRKLSKFLSDDPARIGWFPDGSFAALQQREVA